MAHQNLLTSGLRASVKRTPNKLAIKSVSGTRTYSEPADRIDAIKCMAQNRWNLSAGDVVALISPNCIEYYEYISALAEVGVAVATVNYRLSAPEAKDIILDAGAKLIVYHPSCEALVPDEFECQLIDGPVPPTGACIDAEISEEAIFAIPYTSGTTGKPKGVMISHRSRVMTFYGMAAEYPCFSSDCYFLAIAPLCHGAGFAFGYAPLFFGGTVEILPQFDAEQVITKLGEGAADGIFMVPAHFQAIFNLDKEILESVRETHTLKSIISNASALHQPLKKDIVELFGPDLLNETYGSTEAGIVTNLRPEYQMHKLNCVGTSFVASEVSLRDELGQEVAVDMPGELFSRGPALFTGYWNNPSATAEAISDGWVSVGDIAKRDSDGHIYIVDRKNDMIISGGINVYPREIENVLTEHPCIIECAVFGIRDPKWGESIHAAVVISEEVSAANLTAWLRNDVAGFKLPKHYHFVDVLPRNATGKILKRTLVEEFSVER